MADINRDIERDKKKSNNKFENPLDKFSAKALDTDFEDFKAEFK